MEKSFDQNIITVNLTRQEDKLKCDSASRKLYQSARLDISGNLYQVLFNEQKSSNGNINCQVTMNGVNKETIRDLIHQGIREAIPRNSSERGSNFNSDNEEQREGLLLKWDSADNFDDSSIDKFLFEVFHD
jgi:hypothetical protein